VLGIFAAEPLLRRRAAYGGITFAAFSVFWTTAAFRLAGSPYRYSPAVIGLFGLAGVAGALCASMAGRLADRGWSALTTGAFLATTAAAFGLLALGGHELMAMVAGVVALDLGAQGTHITNQSVIYGLRPGARSRINTAYMVCYFAGGAIGSALAALAWSDFGWSGVCALDALIGLAGVLLWVDERVRLHRGQPL